MCFERMELSSSARGVSLVTCDLGTGKDLVVFQDG